MSNAEQTTNLEEVRTEREATDLVHTIREGAIAASIWKRQPPGGEPYYDFSLSRSWKSTTSGKSGYSRNFYARNRDEVVRVTEKATVWIEEHQFTVEANAA